MTADPGREIRLEIEVPGTPEEVWEAIATGPGISSWFVPAEVAEREGGEVKMDVGPGMEAAGHVTAWEPPRRFVYGSDGDGEGGAPAMAFEFLVEARGGGACVVRLVNSGFGTGEDWDAQYDGMERGWRLFLHNLLLYLTHFRGQPSATIIVNGHGTGTRDEALGAVLSALGIPSAAPGERVAAGADGAPPLAGVVERTDEGMVTLRLDGPAPGVAFVAAEGSGETRFLSIYAYLFGEQARAVAEREAPAWRAWMAQRFPAASEGAGTPAH